MPEILYKLDSITKNFSSESAKEIKNIEYETNHDVKAVEYYIKHQLVKLNIPSSIHELAHFCCTSEDINNLSWGLIVQDSSKQELSPKILHLINSLTSIAEENHDIPMMGRTHGQPATPTTVGKEMANFAYRINYLFNKLQQVKAKGKFNGAVGKLILNSPNFSLLDIALTLFF